MRGMTCLAHCFGCNVLPLWSFYYDWAVVVAQVVAHWTTDWEVLGSISAGSWAFFSSLSYQKCVLNQVPRGGASLLIFLYKMFSCEAWSETSLIRSVWAKISFYCNILVQIVIKFIFKFFKISVSIKQVIIGRLDLKIHLSLKLRKMFLK